MRKCILACCGGVYNSAYKDLIALPFDELITHLEVYNEYQQEQREHQRREMNKAKSGQDNSHEEIFLE